MRKQNTKLAEECVNFDRPRLSDRCLEIRREKFEAQKFQEIETCLNLFADYFSRETMKYNSPWKEVTGR